MIAEALDSGVLTVGAVATLVAFVASGTWWAASTTGKLTAIGKDTSATAKGHRDLTRSLDDHRIEDDAKHSDMGQRLAHIEGALRQEGIITGVRDTGPQDRLRGPTPRPRRREDTGETGPGESR